MLDDLQRMLEQGNQVGFSTVEAHGVGLERFQYECCPGEVPCLHSQGTRRVTVRAFWETGDPVGFNLSEPGPDGAAAAFSAIYAAHRPEDNKNPKKNYRHLLPDSVPPGSPAIHDDTIGGMDNDAFNELIDGINEVMISPPFHQLTLTRIQLSRWLKKVYIANSNGLAAKYMKTDFHLTLGFLLGDNQMEISEGRIFFRQLNPHKVISRAFNLLHCLTEAPLGPGRPADKNCFFILSPEASAFILQEFSGYFKAGGPRETGSIGYPAILNLVDNPLSDGQTGSVPFDDEGVGGRETYLIRKGVREAVITDTAGAFEMNKESTGNGFRSDRSPFPSVGFSNLFIKPTVLPLTNLMTHAGDGVLVALLKLKSRDRTGHIFSAYGYRFRGNDIMEPVHFYFRTTFRGYFLNILKISREIKFFSGPFNVGSPYILTQARHSADNLFEI